MDKIRVLIVDDSAVVRELMSKSLTADSRFEVVGTAVDPYSARDKIALRNVDVLTLDIEMPRMDGLTFLKYLMKYFPLPVVVVSSLTDGKNAASLDALELGAVDIVPKPGGAYSVADILETLKEKILIAASVDFSKIKIQAQKNRDLVLKEPKRLLSQIATTNKLVAVGASTGGTIALEALFKGFTPDFPPTVCVIHMPERFTTTFAQRLDSICQVNVVEAANGMMLVPATVYLAPGNFHLMVRARGKDFFLRVVDGPKVHHQRPAVDVLFQSVAVEAGRNAVGVLLTGMGRDGADGLLKIKNAGGITIAQDEASCIVFGMPKEAIALGAADKVLPLEQIAEAVHQAVKN
jgi:two-component system chemotaxis response regulator CheB